MHQRGDTLHLDGVHIVERMIQNARRINHLPSDITIVHVTDMQRFGRESVRLHFHVGASELMRQINLRTNQEEVK